MAAQSQAADRRLACKEVGGGGGGFSQLPAASPNASAAAAVGWTGAFSTTKAADEPPQARLAPPVCSGQPAVIVVQLHGSRTPHVDGTFVLLPPGGAVGDPAAAQACRGRSGAC